MANASYGSYSWWSPTLSYIEQQFNNSAARYSAELNADYALWEANHLYPAQLQSQLDNYGLEQQLNLQRAHDSVSNMRSALVNAGYNPLLALDGAGMGAGGSGVLSMPHSGASISVNPAKVGDIKLDPQLFSARQKELELLDAEVDTARSESDIARSAATEKAASSALSFLRDSAAISALESQTREDPYQDFDALRYEGWRKLRDTEIKRLEKSSYEDDWKRSLFEDTLKGVSSAKDVIDAVSAFRNPGLSAAKGLKKHVHGSMRRDLWSRGRRK